MLELALAPIVVTAVVFGEGGLEITYFETREQTRPVSRICTIQVDMTGQMDRYGDLQELLSAIVDDALVVLRNPPDQFSGGKSLREQAIERNERAVGPGE